MEILALLPADHNSITSYSTPKNLFFFLTMLFYILQTHTHTCNQHKRSSIAKLVVHYMQYQHNYQTFAFTTFMITTTTATTGHGFSCAFGNFSCIDTLHHIYSVSFICVMNINNNYEQLKMNAILLC